MTTTITLSGTPNTSRLGSWTLTATVTGTDGPYDGFLVLFANKFEAVTAADGFPISGGVGTIDIGGFDNGDVIIHAQYRDSDNTLVPSTSNVIAYSITDGIEDDHYPTDVTKVGSETLEVTWTSPVLHTADDLDNIYVLYWDTAWIGDSTFPINAHVSNLSRDATSDSYTWPSYDHTHTYNAMVIPHKQIIIDFGFGEAIIEHYYRVVAATATLTGNQDPPPFWPDFGLGAQNGEFSLKFDPAAS